MPFTHVIQLAPGLYFSARRSYFGGAAPLSQATRYTEREAVIAAAQMTYRGRAAFATVNPSI